MPEVLLTAYTVSMVDGVGERHPFQRHTASDLAEYAGRTCYQSWSRPNPKTATNEGYLDNIRAQQHYTVTEHGAVTFTIRHVSRAFTHELVRHRHHSFSQMSQRYFVPGVWVRPIIPPFFQGDAIAEQKLNAAWTTAMKTYRELLAYADGLDGANKKRAREAARAVLPNMTPTEIVVTANHSAWRWFLRKRGEIYADAEMREVAVQIAQILKEMEPNLYADVRVGRIFELSTGYETTVVKFADRPLPEGWEITTDER